MPVGSRPRPGIEPGSVIPGTRYRALRQIGAGAGGVVYEVEHLGLGRRFALRMLGADLAQRADVVQRARADWQTLAQLRHPHIARVTDAAMTARGVPYSVTEQLPGETLRQRLARRRSVSVPEALGIARELASALAAAHAIGVAHGHVAPHHVFLASDGCAKLCDFGNYDCVTGLRSPEPDADVYGLGLVLFEMIAGRPAREVSRVKRRSRGAGVRGQLPLLAEVVPGVAAAVSEIVARLLRPDPSNRPTLAAVIAELRRLECRYERQVSTTQETAHYVTRRLPFVIDTAPPSSEIGVIVPLPSQTLEGIPWTVITPARADRTNASGAPAVPLPAAPEPPPEPPPHPAPPPVAPARCAPRSSVPRRKFELRLLLVMAGSLLMGVLVASVARRSAAGAAGVSASGAASAQGLLPGERRAAAPACAVRPAR